MLLVNVADGAGLAFARRQVATVRAVFPHVIVLAEVQTLKGRRFGNLVIAASRSPLPSEWLPRLMAAGPHPAKVAQGAELDEFARGARVATDADSTPSPQARVIRLRALTLTRCSRSPASARRSRGASDPSAARPPGLRGARGTLEKRTRSERRGVDGELHPRV